LIKRLVKNFAGIFIMKMNKKPAVLV